MAPGAYDMAREFRALSALWPVFPPAPRPFLLCEDASVLGAPFFVMERRRGLAIRKEMPPQYRDRPDLYRRLSEAMRPADVVARFAGDEFLVLAEVDSSAAAAQLAERLIDRLQRPFTVAGKARSVTASLGVAYSADPADPPEEILRRADGAMYLAKQRGRNRAEVAGQR